MSMNAFSTWIAEIATIDVISFSLRPVKSTLRHPFRPVLVLGGVDLRDEILVAREDHDDDEVAGEGEVDQASTPRMTSDSVASERARRNATSSCSDLSSSTTRQTTRPR